MEFASAYQLKVEYPRCLGHGNVAFWSDLPVSIIQAGMKGNSWLTHPDDVDECFIGASGLRLSMGTPGSVNSQTPIRDISVSVHGSGLPPIILIDGDFSEPRFLCDESHSSCQIHTLVEIRMDVLPVPSHPQKESFSNHHLGQQHTAPQPFTASVTTDGIAFRFRGRAPGA